jgi:hypothetical protein
LTWSEDGSVAVKKEKNKENGSAVPTFCESNNLQSCTLDLFVLFFPQAWWPSVNVFHFNTLRPRLAHLSAPDSQTESRELYQTLQN